jgi:hypothetical protein
MARVLKPFIDVGWSFAAMNRLQKCRALSINAMEGGRPGELTWKTLAAGGTTWTYAYNPGGEMTRLAASSRMTVFHCGSPERRRRYFCFPPEAEAEPTGGQ